MKSKFLDKLIAHLDLVDPESLQTHFLRLAREKGLLETIFEAIQEGVVVLDGLGKLTYANRAAEALLGFRTEELEGQSITRYLRELDWGRISQLVAGEWSKLVHSEIEIDYPEHRYVSFYVVPLASVSSSQEGVVLILRDVTQDRAHEASKLEREKLNALTLLAAGVAHEIGNPLNALTIHLQLLERALRRVPREDAVEMGELLDVARKEVTRLDTIITQFLRAIRPSKPQLMPAQIEDVLSDTLTLLQHEIENRHIKVEVEQTKPLPAIRLDSDQIKQAFFNIIKNALQAMPDGGQLNISLTSSERGLAVSFHDSGMGIAAERFGRIFEPYFTTKAEGSGLGLMVVQRIIQDHGGQLEVMSRENEGTTFTVFLPFAERRMRVLTPHKDTTGKRE